MSDQAQKLREIAQVKHAERARAAGSSSSSLMMDSSSMTTAQKRPPLGKSFSTSSTSSSPSSSSTCTSIAVTSGKGGVGKTTLALILAASFARHKKKALLLDADLGLANIHILLGIAPRFNISHVVNGECSINDVITEAAPGVFLVPGASGLEKLANMDASRLERLRMDFMALESQYDFLIMDTGAGIGSGVTSFARHADLVLLVMTPDPSSLADAYAMVKVLYDKGNYNIAVVVNTVSNEREGFEAFEKLNALVMRFLQKPVDLYAILPSDKEVVRLGRKQIHLNDKNSSNGRFYGCTGLLAEKICGKTSSTTSLKSGGFFSRFFGKTVK